MTTSASDPEDRPSHPPSRYERQSVSPQGLDGARAFEAAGGDLSAPGVRDLVATLAEHAPALLPLALGDTELPSDILMRPLERLETEASLREAFLAVTSDLDDGPELRRRLRRLRHRAIVRIALREVLRLADVDQTSAEMAALAAAAIDAAFAACTRSAFVRYGEPRDEDGRLVSQVVLGMGKLGGSELNLGSDVDLCFFYGTDEAKVGDGELSAHELFARIASRTTQALAEVTEDGFCFRVDLRLRPEGTRGPLVNSLASAERYYEAFGRTWERGALLRARPIAGELAFGEELLDVLRPFVFRRAVDPSVATEMAEMLRRTRRELRIDGERDIKLGRGGIREAEFFVQALQLVWGGRHRELQVRGTVEALWRLRAAGLVSAREAEDFEAHWALLRRIEHRIHMRAGYQTHDIPPRGEEREEFARSLGFEDGAALEEALSGARHRIAALFASLVEDGGGPATSPEIEALFDLVVSGAPSQEIAERVADALAIRDVDAAAAHLARLARQPESPLAPGARERRDRLGERLLAEITEAADPDMALQFTADFFTRLGGAWGYDRLFVEQPTILRRLIGLFGASTTLSQTLVGHPESIDPVLVEGGTPTPESIRAAHAEGPVTFEGELPDPEEFVAALRRIKREVTLGVGLAYVSGELALTEVEDLLTSLATAQIDAALRYATAESQARFGRPAAEATAEAPAAMIVVGLGKLGSSELGFGGDLDLILLYGADGQTEPTPEGRSIGHSELFTRIGQRMMRLLSQPDFEGTGYETDARLRPSGSQGMLVVSLAAFDRYHEEKAQSWERQTLIRARAVAGDARLAALAEERFARVAYEGRAPSSEELVEMRRRVEMESAGERRGRYHPKLGYGGLVDIEFLVQWLQMRHGSSDPSVRRRRTLSALRALSRAGYIDRTDAEGLEEGWTFFRRVEQAIKLLDVTRDAVLIEGGPIADRVARRLGIRERDGHLPSQVLMATWRRHAEEVRAIFERRVAPMGVDPPWA